MSGFTFALGSEHRLQKAPFIELLLAGRSSDPLSDALDTGQALPKGQRGSQGRLGMLVWAPGHGLDD